MKLGEFAYILVTPAKDEEDNLPALLHSIVNQSIRPVAWFIVDDASKDQTVQIIEEASLKYPWIHCLRLTTKHPYAWGEHMAVIWIQGFDYAMDYCRDNSIDYKYIALSDADIVYPWNYFEECIRFLHENVQYGIVSGRMTVQDSEGNIYEQHKMRFGEGSQCTGRIWRKEAFDDINGYLVTKAPDTVSSIMAELKGWQQKRITNVVYCQTRETKSKHSIWRGYSNRGENAYYVNANPLSMFNTVVDIIFISREKKKLIKSVALLSGYWKSVFLRKQKLDNDDVKRYVGSYRRVMKNYWVFLKSFVGKRKTPSL